MQRFKRKNQLTYIDDMEEDDNSGGNSNYQKSFEINKKKLENKFPCKIQKQRLNNSGKFRGKIENANKDAVSLINVFIIVHILMKLNIF